MVKLLEVKRQKSKGPKLEDFDIEEYARMRRTAPSFPIIDYQSKLI